MKLTFEEACSAAADLFEAAPELWTSRALGRDAKDVSIGPLEDEAEKWCSGGMVMAAMGEHNYMAFCAFCRLQPFATALGFEWTSDANNLGGRLVAIKMLRMAAGEIK